MNKEILGGTAGTVLSAVGTATQTNELLQTISLVITILGGLITFIVIPLLTWYKNAKADGKITQDELSDAKDIIVDGSQAIKEKVEKNDSKGGE